MLCWFVGLLLVLAQSVSAQSPQHIFVSAPNIVRVGNTETVLINVFNTDLEPEVTVKLKNVDGSEIGQPQTNIVRQSYPVVVRLYVDPESISVPQEEGALQYIKLEVTCPQLNNFNEEKELLVSYEEGFVFIQTDKPIYTPDQSVLIRLMVLDQDLKFSDQIVRMDILSPQGVIVKRVTDIDGRNFSSHAFMFPHEPLFGNWSVMVSYGKELKSNRSVQFEVKEYVLPTFSVKLTPPDHVLSGDQVMSFTVEARYVYDKPVHGKFFTKVGIVEFDGEITIYSRMKGELLPTGFGHFQVETDAQLGQNWFTENRGKHLYVEVSVLESASGIAENVSDTSAMIVDSPYTFRWDRTVRYFKRGMPYLIKSDLAKTNGKPASNVPVEVSASCTDDDGEQLVLFAAEGEASLERTNNDGQVNFRIDVQEDCASLNIRLETKAANLKREGPDGELIDNNAEFDFDVQPQLSPTGEDFLLIRLLQDENIVTVDQTLHAEVVFNTAHAVPWLAYYVVSRGTISEAHVNDQVPNNNMVLRVRITFEMAPSARIVAFYINQAGQVIADSLWIEITQTCANEVSVSVKGYGDRPQNTPVLAPDTDVEIQVDAYASSTVGLLGVDKAVYLLRDFHRLTKSKMYKTMDTYDAGCGPGGGRDSPSIFKDSGIMVLSSAALDVRRREVHGCILPRNPRRRRSTDLEEQYDDPIQQWACRRGANLRTVHLTCSERLVDNFLPLVGSRHPDLTQGEVNRLKRIFRRCCRAAREEQEQEELDEQGRGRSGDGVHLGDVNGIANYAEPASIRSDFLETWIFEVMQILPGQENSVTRAFTVPSSITEWSLTAVVLSAEYGMCVSRPSEIIVRKDFFIQLHMPYSVVRKEQIEVIATIFNYRQEELEVEVRMRRTEAVCSNGEANLFSDLKTIIVPGNDAMSVKYVLIGLEIGNHPIAVMASAGDIEDAVEKELNVIPEGVERTIYYAKAIDPMGSLAQSLDQEPQVRAGRSDVNVLDVDTGEHQTQLTIFDIRRPNTAVPDSERCEFSVIGNVMGPVVTSMIGGLESVLTLPRGCGEQTMIYLAPNVYVLRYLTTLDAATDALVNTAKHNIRQGIVSEMTHRRADGSFSVWGNRAQYPSSTWLTAFVNKVFCHASHIEGVFVDPKVTCQAMEWLIDTTQRPDGAFREIYRVHHREMTGGIQGDATLTAFVLISLLECECPTLADKVAQSKADAVAFLEDAPYTIMDRPYAVAISAYALALADSPGKHAAVNRLASFETLDPDTNHIYYRADGSGIPDSSKPYWYRVRPSAISVETTGYALLAMLEVGGYSAQTYPVVQWLTEQQNYGGGFASTQDTVIALQALSAYSSTHGGTELNMRCNIKFTDNVVDPDTGEVTEHEIEEFHFQPENALVQRHAKPPVGGSLHVKSTGTGTGQMNLRFTYNTISEDLNERHPPFEILINAREARHGPLEEDQPAGGQRGDLGDRSRIGRLRRQAPAREPDRGQLIVHVAVEVGYHKNEPTNMAIIDVGLYTGFKPILEDLEQIVETSEYINRFEVSQRSVIFYADYIPPVGTLPPLMLEFNARREFVVGNLQPVAVKVYDYYNPTEEAVKFYHPTSDDESASTLASICEEDTCVCAAGACYVCGGYNQNAGLAKEVLLQKSCESAQTYVYRIQIQGRSNRYDQSSGFTVYNVQIMTVLKIADDKNIVVNNTREFWVSSSCSCNGKMRKKNSNHLVIGKTVLPYVDQAGRESYKYVLDSNAVVENWPKTRRNKNADQIDKIDAFAEDMYYGRNNCQ